MTGLNLTRFAKSGLAAVAAMALVGGASAATITWGATFDILSAADIANNGAAVQADSYGGGNPTVNGVDFNLDSGVFSSPANWTTPTGDAGLDGILQSHNHITGPGSFVLSLTGLTNGVDYQIQIISTHDVRSCCSARDQMLDDGAGNFTGPTFVRGTGGSVIGTFTATGTTQDIQMLGLAAVDPDAGMSGYILRQIPEPGSLALLGLGGLAMLRRRR